MTIDIQKKLFEEIRRVYTGNQRDFVYHLATLMHISNDGVYRRLRGDTLLNLEDLRLLSSQYQVSIDRLLQVDTESLNVKIGGHSQQFDLKSFLQDIASHFEKNTNGQHSKIFFNAKEIPIFYYFRFPRLLAFKSFFWQTILDNKDSSEQTPWDQYQVLGLAEASALLNQYYSVESVEIWSDEVLDPTFKQILYLTDLGQLAPEEAFDLLEQLKQLLAGIEQECQSGLRNTGLPFEIYYNEVLIGDNTLILESKGSCRVFLPKDISRIIEIADPVYGEQAAYVFQKILRKSTPLFRSSERARGRFFRGLLKKIEKCEKKIHSLTLEEED